MLGRYSSHPLNLASTFSYNLFFGSRDFQVQPKNLHKDMAMCKDDSIWIVSYLLDDHFSRESLDGKSEIRGFPGQIGPSGIAFLRIPPLKPTRRHNSIHSFRNIVPRPFDGHLQNNFRTTSLHLSLRAAESPLSHNFTGMQDDELYVLDKLVSIHEGGERVTDLDIPSPFSGRNYAMLGPCKE